MQNKNKAIIYFVLVFFAVFLALNFRFVLSNLNYYFSDKQPAEVSLKQGQWVASLPVVGGSSEAKTVLGRASTNDLGAISGIQLSLYIPSISVSAPIVLGPSTDEDTIYKKLKDGVVHYAGTPMPGDAGTAIILGHSSAYPWYRGDYGSVFALLGKLQSGDKFQIQKGESWLTYRVSDSLVFSPFDDSGQLSEFEQSGGSSVILVSCWPVGTNYKRLAVKADLI